MDFRGSYLAAGRAMALLMAIIAGVILYAVFRDPEPHVFQAIRSGNLAEVQHWITHTSETQLTSRQGITPLMVAAQSGQEAIAQRLIQSGVQVNAADNDGRTALLYAVQAGNESTTALLLRAGAYPEPVDHTGRTPLMVAASSASSEYGTDPFPAIMRQLVQAGADVDARQSTGRTALMLAAGLGRAHHVETLLDLGASPHVTCEKGMTARDWARKYDKVEVLRVLP